MVKISSTSGQLLDQPINVLLIISRLVIMRPGRLLNITEMAKLSHSIRASVKKISVATKIPNRTLARIFIFYFCDIMTNCMNNVCNYCDATIVGNIHKIIQITGQAVATRKCVMAVSLVCGNAAAYKCGIDIAYNECSFHVARVCGN
jgi:hypothetical protein